MEKASNKYFIQFKAMMTKNFIIMSRNKRDMAQEIAIPIVMLIALVIITNLNPSSVVAAVQHPTEYTVPQLADVVSGKEIWLAPCRYNNYSDPVFQLASELQTMAGVNTTCFQCETPQQCGFSILGNYPYIGEQLFAAIVFDASVVWDGSQSIKYKLLMDRDKYVPGALKTVTTPLYKPDGSFAPPDSVPLEYAKYYLPMQSAANRLIARYFGAAAPSTEFTLSVRSFPQPQHISTGYDSLLQGLIPIYITAIFTLQVRVLLTRILEEKERKIKITMKIMGLNDVVYWLSWFVTAFLKVGFLVTLVAIIVCYGKIFPHSEPGLVWLFFMLFGATAIGFCFAMTALFSKSAFGAVIGMLMYLAAAAPGYALTTAATPTALKAFLSLLAPCGFNLGLNIITNLELRKVGLTPINVSDSSAAPAGISMGSIMGILAFDAVFYFAIAWYLDKVVPTEFGIAEHPLFCIGRRKQAVLPSPPKNATPVTGNPLVGTVAGSAFEQADLHQELVGDAGQRDGVKILGLTKTFGGKGGPRTVVDSLSLELLEGQVTCLLGHNGTVIRASLLRCCLIRIINLAAGAGKTTTISMLTGLVPPTSGDVVAYGHSVVSETASVRDMIGLCPQHDVLFDQISASEHIQLFGGIKGLTTQEVKFKIDDILADVGLQEKAGSWANELSGGMKRRLSLALALMGNPKIVLLDEPTSGLDPGARRQVWRLIQKYKAGRVMVLTTHFMDEADILGDRIALMARGRLRLCGSPLFMKTKFGTGYQLKLTCMLESNTDADEALTALTHVVRNHVPDCTATKNQVEDGAASRNVEYLFLLPQNRVAKFPELFDALATAQDTPADSVIAIPGCSIVAHMITMTTLEEAYLRLAEQLEHEEAVVTDAVSVAVPAVNPEHKVAAADAHDSSEFRKWWWVDVRRRSLLNGPQCSEPDFVERIAEVLPKASVKHVQGSMGFLWNQIRINMWRRYLQVSRNPRAIWLQCIVPLLFVGAGVIFRLARGVGKPHTPVAVLMQPLQWGYLSGHSSFASSVRTGVPPSYLLDILSAWNASSLVPGSPSVMLNTTAVGPSIVATDDVLAAQHYLTTATDILSAGPSSYAIHMAYNYTLTNVLPIMSNLWDSSILTANTSSFAAWSWSELPIQPTFESLPILSVGRASTIGDFVASALLGFYLALGFITIPAIQANVIVAERETKSKQLQMLMGASIPGYWLSMWLWDTIQYSLPFVGGMAIIFSSSHESFYSSSQYGAVVVLLLLFGVAMPLPTYIVTFSFNSAADAQKITRVGYSLLLILFFVVTFVLDFPQLVGDSSGWHVLSQIINYVGQLFPPYALAKGYTDTLTLGSCSAAVVAAGLPCSPPGGFDWELAGSKIFFLVVAIPVWLYLIVIRERRSVAVMARAVGSTKPADDQPAAVADDDDVTRESQHVDELLGKDQAQEGLLVAHLRKLYASKGRPEKLAVRDLSLHVARDQIFGLLGPNGAGKTTSIAMLVTDIAATEGIALIEGVPVDTIRRNGASVIGYCPQFDALYDLMTGKEILQFFATLNGVADEHVEPLVEAALSALDLQRIKHVLSKVYSGGNKRRLSLALAYMSAPSVVFLDECSTGVDPFARKRMFEVIQRARLGRSTVMTTHVMEEADALCTRIGIMVNGSLACVGTPQHLKEKYGRGYLVELVLDSEINISDHGMQNLQSLVNEFSSEAKVLECTNGHVRFEVSGINLAAAFRQMEAAKATSLITDYSVSHTTLEAVFLSFNRVQEAINRRNDTGNEPRRRRRCHRQR